MNGIVKYVKITPVSGKAGPTRRPAKRNGRSRRGEGSLKLRGNTWWYVIADPRNPGKKIESWCEAGAYNEALKKKADALGKSRKPGAPVKPINVGELLTEYGKYIA